MSKKQKPGFYRWCLVPMCTSTSIKTPEKTFIQVPKCEKRRKLWFDAARREFSSVSLTSNVFMCEDHFDLENDLENYMKWKLVGGLKLMKKDVVPHKFNCQKDAKIKYSNIPRNEAIKWQRKYIIAEACGDPSAALQHIDNMKSLEGTKVNTVFIKEERLDDSPQTSERLFVSELKDSLLHQEANEYPSTSGVQDPLATELLYTDIKIEEDSDVDTKENIFEGCSNFFNTDNVDQFNLQMDVEDILAREAQNDIRSYESAVFRKENNTRPAETVTKELIKDTSRIPTTETTTDTQRKDSEMVGAELCVLCAKDMSKLRKKNSVIKFQKMIFTVTGVNINRYGIKPECCGVCYRNLLAIRNFRNQVFAASFVIKKKLSEVSQKSAANDSEFASVGVAKESSGENSDLACSEEKGNKNCKIVSEKAGPSGLTGNMPDVIVNVSSSQLADPCQSEKRTTAVHRNISDESGTICSDCGARYNKINYKKHMQTHEAIFVACTICRRRLRLSNIKNHMQMHQPKEKCICSQCGKSYNGLYYLRRHEVTHGEKQHKCRVCSASFHFYKYLVRHMRSHSGEKPFACTHCGKTFSILWNLQQHQRLHTNSKPYKCKLCSAAFRHNVTLKGHLATSHTANEIATSKPHNSIDESKSVRIKSAENDEKDHQNLN